MLHLILVQSNERNKSRPLAIDVLRYTLLLRSLLRYNVYAASIYDVYDFYREHK